MWTFLHGDCYALNVIAAQSMPVVRCPEVIWKKQWRCVRRCSAAPGCIFLRKILFLMMPIRWKAQVQMRVRLSAVPAAVRAIPVLSTFQVSPIWEYGCTRIKTSNGRKPYRCSVLTLNTAAQGRNLILILNAMPSPLPTIRLILLMNLPSALT